jgi:hypothetical protein
MSKLTNTERGSVPLKVAHSNRCNLFVVFLAERDLLEVRDDAAYKSQSDRLTSAA